MANYTASLEVQARKVHTCVLCGCVFRYTMARSVTGTGGSPDAARENLLGNIKTTLETGVDSHPCPTCGFVQPEMVGAARSGSHVLQAVAMGFVIVFMGPLIGTHALSIPTAALVALVVYGAVAAWAYRTATQNPNERLVDRLNEASAEVAAGKLAIETPGDKANPKLKDAPAATDGFHPVACGLLAAAVALGVSPELVRIGGGGAVNPSFYPAVIGPGDTSTYYFKKQISSMKGYWRGKAIGALVGLEGLGEDGILPLELKANDRDWGRSISLKNSEKAQGSTIWAAVTMPAEPALAGRTVDMVARIFYEYPAMSGASSFEVRADKLEEATKVTLSRPGLGNLYGWLAWLGTWGGGIVLFVAACWLSSRAGKLQGNPHQTFPIQRDA